MDTLDYIIKKYGVDPEGKLPIEIPNAGKADLAKLLHELDFKIGVEVGVAEGKYSQKLCEANPQMKIYGVDAWKIYGNYADYSAQKLDSLYSQAKKQLAPFSNYEFIKEFSMDAVRKFEDNSLDFVYIDANHENPYITEDITEWSKKVKPGGIISGHDYFRYRGKNGNLFNVIEATQKYTKENNIKPWFVLGLSAKIPGLVRDPSRSWFWVKK